MQKARPDPAKPAKAATGKPAKAKSSKPGPVGEKDLLLDEALRDTFPSSDPVATETTLISGGPRRRPKPRT